MGNQRTFASMVWNGKGKVTRRERFLGEMDAVIPWSRPVRLIEPHYPKTGQGRQPLGLEKMLRIYFLRQWFQSVGPTGRRRDLRQRVDAPVRAGGVGRRRGAGREYDSALSPPARAARADPRHLRCGGGPFGRTTAVAALGHHRGRDHHRGADSRCMTTCAELP